ncbi:hypothetical protein [Anaeroselena agilis]|uniref:Uncharacterized protein n=1 Tax=Anaeroselena agilis TaxID=3063788 RepID=A0ABU3NU38_9FIRM|nr:hypothetical protein [Selenomonadales bacterium 4137-cl]
MEEAVVHAYRMARSKDLFTITQILEKLLRQKKAASATAYEITIGQVRDILQRRRLKYYSQQT